MSDESVHVDSHAKADEPSFRFVCESVKEKLGVIMESVPDGIIIVDTSGRIVLVNSQAETMFGYERGDLVSLMIETLVPVCLRERHVNNRNSYAADPHRRPMGQQVKLFGLRQDGAEFPVEISLSPMQFDDHGLLICAAVRDVTEKIRLTSIYRDSPIGLCCFDTELRYIDVNKWLAALNGISIEEHLGRTVKEVLPDVASEVESQLRHVLETGEPILDGEVVAETPAYPNMKKHFLHNYYPLKSNEGAIVGVSCAIQDVTLRKKAVEALENSRHVLEDRVRQRTKELEESNQHVRLILDSTAEAIYGLDLEGNCTFCNSACVELLGYDRSDELLGQNMHDLIHHTRLDGSEYPMHEYKIYEAFRHGKETHLDDEVLWKADGSSFFAEYRSFPVRRGGELIGSVVTFLDITERKRIAETLRAQQANLAHASRLSTLGEMAAGLAHELNQPLTAMSAFAEGALVRLDRGKLSETEVAPIFSRIADDAQRAGEIIRRLRNFVQKREVQYHEIDVNQLVREVCRFIESDATQQDITLQLKLDSGLSTVEADAIEIQQVLLNLIRNACDAISQADSGERIIMISSHQGNTNRVEVTVEDSGPGISDSMAEQVFEPFYTSKPDGLGIGLRICQNILESHGGKIWLGHSSMRGASVHFDLPAQQKENQTDPSFAKSTH